MLKHKFRLSGILIGPITKVLRTLLSGRPKGVWSLILPGGRMEAEVSGQDVISGPYIFFSVGKNENCPFYACLITREKAMHISVHSV